MADELYQCPECGLKYEDEKTAKQCEAWCKGHPGSCSVEISKKAV